MTTVAAPTRWTYDDYLRLDDDQAYQIVEGDLIVSPAPSIVHQRVSSRLYSRLQPFVAERNLGEVFYAPVDVVFGEQDIVQPDLLFVRRENAGIVGEQAVVGTPDLIVEILSPGSLHLDRHRKRALYERAGVPEFWLVDPTNRAIEVFRLGERGYELASFAAETALVRSVLLDGFEVDLISVFCSGWASLCRLDAPITAGPQGTVPTYSVAMETLMLKNDFHFLQILWRARSERFEDLADYEFVERLLRHAKGMIPKQAHS